MTATNLLPILLFYLLLSVAVTTQNPPSSSSSHHQPDGLTSRSVGPLLVSRLTSSPLTTPSRSAVPTSGGDGGLRRNNDSGRGGGGGGSHLMTKRQRHRSRVSWVRRRRGFPGFNLLWLVSAKIEKNKNELKARKMMSQRRGGKAGSPATPSPSSAFAPATSDGNGVVNLNSNLPRLMLRYERVQPEFRENRRTINKQQQQQKNNRTTQSTIAATTTATTRRKYRVTSENFVEIETTFKISNSSGNGYLLTGRAVDSNLKYHNFPTRHRVMTSRPRSGADDDDDDSNEKMTSSVASWFGVYCRVQNRRIVLRMEYRNVRMNQKFAVPIEDPKLLVGEWHKLAIRINFQQSSINYWLNCTSHRGIKLTNSTIQYSYFTIFRLLHQRTKQKKSLKVAFKSLILHDGGRHQIPRQCRHHNMTRCPGGREYMTCGPSCVGTCTNQLSYQICTSSCSEGCHCPVGQVLHHGTCISVQSCPCYIEKKKYSANVQIPINNELCTCIGGSWKCFAVGRIREGPRNQTVKLGSNATLTCRVSGRPLPRVDWLLPRHVKHRIVSSGGGRVSILQLYNVTADYSGNYTCAATRTYDGWSSNATAHVMVTDPPRITSLPPTFPVILGTPVISIDCYVSGLPPPRATWARTSGKQWPENARYFAVAPGVFRLKITNVKQADAGEYKCYAMNVVNSTIASVVVLVEVPSPSTMEFSKSPSDICVRPGHTATFPCKVIGHHADTNVTWLKDGRELTVDNKQIRQFRHKLVVRRVERRNAGIYTCVVKVQNSTIQEQGRLMIKGKMLAWSSWSQCSVTCGRGSTTKQRACTGIPPNSKTCHGKFEISKFCNSQVCPGVCSSFGDPHYTTFDGFSFNFQGNCGYILAQDVPGNNFKIIQYNHGCGSHVSCTHKITIILGFPSLSGVIDLNRDGLVFLNGVPLTLPYLSNRGQLFIDHVGLYLTMKVADEIEVRWAVPHRLYVTVSGKYSARTKGLCGNFNQNSNDDRKTPSGKSLSSDLKFGQSWLHLDGDEEFRCSAARVINDPCSMNMGKMARANDICQFLLDEESFGACHDEVSPLKFIETCKTDICRSRIEDTNIYFCIALSAYAEECSRKGRVLRWRTDDICPVKCSGGRVYMECGPKCVQYCQSSITNKLVCNANNRCLPGCYCPKGQVLHKEKCINLKDCPCVAAGVEYYNKAAKKMNCRRCICTNGVWRCSFDRQLCEYPPTVVDGPHTQVVPYGESTTFCCQVVGIPKPRVEWYHNGVRITSTVNKRSEMRMNRWFKFTHDSNSTLHLTNISIDNTGSYVCNATNSLGSFVSPPAYLRIADPHKSSCKSTPSENLVRLPENCFVTKIQRKGTKNHLNLVDLGKCSGSPCYSFTSGSSKSQQSNDEVIQSTCNKSRYCCQPSITKPLRVTCTYENYISTFLITIVRKCKCMRCEDNLTLIEGSVRSNSKDQAIKHAKLSYRGRTVGYTSNTGSFRFTIPHLPPDTSAISLKISDILFKRFTTAVMNIAVTPGRSTLHTIRMHESQIRVSFPATKGLRYIFKPADGYSHRIRLTIPPESLIRDRLKMPYRGPVTAIMTLLDKRNLNGNGSVIGMNLPGTPLAITLSGEENLLSPSIILYVTFYTAQGKILDLIPGNTAVLSLSAGGLHSNLKLWTLEDITGRWRESKDRLDVAPRVTKRGKKMLIVTARVNRFNVGVALGTHNAPCYLRVQVLNARDEIIPEVRVTFKARTSSYERNNATTQQSVGFKSYVDRLTSSHTSINGLCLPTGCRDEGILSAFHPGQNLLLLQPEVPPEGMGEVVDQHITSINHYRPPMTSYSNETSSSSYTSYFQTKQECDETKAGLLTYKFRDRNQQSTLDGSKLARYSISLQNRVIRTFASARPPRIGVKFCHFKIKIRFRPSFFRGANASYARDRVIESVTFSNSSNQISVNNQHLTMLGWRHIPIEPPGGDDVVNADGTIDRLVCIDYRCGDSRIFVESHPFVFITVRYTDSWSLDQNDRPNCNFLRDPRGDHDRLDDLPQPDHGGYIYFTRHVTRASPSTPTTTTTSHDSGDDVTSGDGTTSTGTNWSFDGRTLLESKRSCMTSSAEHFSAYFVCV